MFNRSQYQGLRKENYYVPPPISNSFSHRIVDVEWARRATTETVPDTITVQMYRLSYPHGGLFEPNHSCQSGETFFGCTAFDQDSGEYSQEDRRPYPYPTNPVTIGIETDYLLDVVPKEISIGSFHPTAIKAQVIAARSYAYHHIAEPGTIINNSTQFQAFIPYKFNELNIGSDPSNESNPCASNNLNGNQQKLCRAAADRYYISYGTGSEEENAAFTEFFGDYPNQTVTTTDFGNHPYLLSVLDPISSHPAILIDGHGRGMSQKGASRWAHGNLGFRGNLDPWSVRWTRVEQILFHYYTDVHLRDQSGNRLSPFYRWNPLALTGLPSVLYPSQSSEIIIQVQNTSAANWHCNAPMSNMSVPVPFIINFELRARLIKRGYPSLWLPDSPSLCGLEKGQSQTVTFSVENIPQEWGSGVVTLRFDMRAIGSPSFWFSSPESDDVPGWPVYEVNRCLINCEVYIPHLSRFEHPRARD